MLKKKKKKPGIPTVQACFSWNTESDPQYGIQNQYENPKNEESGKKRMREKERLPLNKHTHATWHATKPPSPLFPSLSALE